MQQSTSMIELQALTRRYGKSAALDRLTLHQAPSGIVGLLGRNGAGKSTLLRILTGQDRPTEGQAMVFGELPFDNAGVLPRMCLVPDRPQFGNLRTIKAVLEASAALYPNWNMEEACDLVYRFDLLDPSGRKDSGDLPAAQRFRQMRDKRVKALSRGMQTSLNLIVGLASHAPLTFFDEPSLGLDAVMRERFYDILLEYRHNSQRCFVVSTHLIDEVARILDEVILIDRGRLLDQGTVSQLTENAYILTGASAAVPEGAQCLGMERIGDLVTLYCRGERPASLPKGVSLAPLNLQRLFVLLTDPAKGGKS